MEPVACAQSSSSHSSAEAKDDLYLKLAKQRRTLELLSIQVRKVSFY